MLDSSIKIIQNPIIAAGLFQAWMDSKPGLSGGHEEGGFILKDREGSRSLFIINNLIKRLIMSVSVSLPATVLQDKLAVSLACAMATANEKAKELGVNVLQSIISINQGKLEESTVWKINYGPKNYIHQRGGDVQIEVDIDDGTIKKVLHGQ